MSERTELIRSARRVVVKVGSGVLAGGRAAGLDPAALRRLSAAFAAARAASRELVVVSSGAILAGFEKLQRPRSASIQLKQAAAAVGQGRLMAGWSAALARHGLVPAQVLLTQDDFRHRRRYLHARNTLFTLLELGALPIVNENDTVATEEIQFGENDILSSLVAGLVDADLLVILSDIDGLHTADPKSDPRARLIPTVHPDRPAEFTLGAKGPLGSGGMEAKVRAAQRAAAAGVPALLANGLKKGTLERALAGEEIGTLFVQSSRTLNKRKQWLAYAAHPKGTIEVDEGARLALEEKGKSLLPSGVRGVKSSFQSGDVVGLSAAGVEFARGLSNYSSAELASIQGLQSRQIEGVLGHKKCDEVVHRDNLVLLKK